MTNKKKKLKTEEIRLNEMNVIKSKLEKIELDQQFSEIVELMRIMDNFIKTGESNSGKMPILNSNKDICYIFSNRLCIKSQVTLLIRK